VVPPTTKAVGRRDPTLRRPSGMERRRYEGIGHSG
jgi:hypothetical protein